MAYKSILGTQEYSADDRVELIAHFISEHLTSENVEIEAKIGYFLQEEVVRKFHHIALLPDSATRFKAEVSKMFFDSVRSSIHSVKAFQHSEHSELEDTIYGASGNSKLRATHRQTGEFVENIRKTRLKDLNFIVNPATGLGFRISANLEEKIDEIPATSRPNASRLKNRDSFFFQWMRYDLTAAEMRSNKSYEIEIEIFDTQFVRDIAHAYVNGTNKAPLIGIANKLWHNIISVCCIKPKAIIHPLDEDSRFIQQRTDNYSAYWGNIRPVIGDYLYEISQQRQDEPSYLNN